MADSTSQSGNRTGGVQRGIRTSTSLLPHRKRILRCEAQGNTRVQQPHIRRSTRVEARLNRQRRALGIVAARSGLCIPRSGSARHGSEKIAYWRPTSFSRAPCTSRALSRRRTCSHSSSDASVAGAHLLAPPGQPLHAPNASLYVARPAQP